MEGEEEVKGMCVLCCVCGKKVLKRKIKGQTDEQSNQQISQSFVHSPKYPQEAGLSQGQGSQGHPCRYQELKP